MQLQPEEAKKYEEMVQQLKTTFDTGVSNVDGVYKRGKRKIRVIITRETKDLYNLMIFTIDDRIILCDRLNLQFIVYYILNSDFKDVVFKQFKNNLPKR